jgi:hypothetical protein
MLSGLGHALQANPVAGDVSTLAYDVLLAKRAPSEDTIGRLRQEIARHEDLYSALRDTDDDQALRHFRAARVLSALLMALTGGASDEVIYEAANALREPDKMVNLLLRAS